MPSDKIEFPVRFIVDEHFIRDILTDRGRAKDIIIKMSHIHRNSKHYPMEHNIIFDECFQNSISDKIVRGQALLGAMHPISYPDFVKNEPDLVCKMIKYAISLANKKPYKVVILTSENKYQTYSTNQHYSGQVAASIPIFYGGAALAFIDLISSYSDG